MTDGDASGLVGVNGISSDKRTTGVLAVTSGKESSSDSTRTVYDLYVTRKIGERLTYVFEYARGTEANGAAAGKNTNW